MCEAIPKMNLEEKRKEERLQTFREQRLNVNFMLLAYWIPAYFFDLSNQFPTYNGTHYFWDFLSNWGQTMILMYLISSIFMDVIPNEDREQYKRTYNKFTQITVVQAFIVSALFWGLIGAKDGEYDFQMLHEHLMNLVVVLVSYFVSEVRFRKRDMLNMYGYGWIYMINTYVAYLFGRDSIYSILTWGERDPSIDFPLSTWQLACYSIFGGITILHGFMYCVDQLRWKVYERKEKKNQIQLAMQRAGS